MDVTNIIVSIVTAITAVIAIIISVVEIKKSNKKIKIALYFIVLTIDILSNSSDFNTSFAFSKVISLILEYSL